MFERMSIHLFSLTLVSLSMVFLPHISFGLLLTRPLSFQRYTQVIKTPPHLIQSAPIYTTSFLKHLLSKLSNPFSCLFIYINFSQQHISATEQESVAASHELYLPTASLMRLIMSPFLYKPDGQVLIYACKIIRIDKTLFKKKKNFKFIFTQRFAGKWKRHLNRNEY